jgi:hypothetical protein
MAIAPSKPEEFRDRTKVFALRIVRLFRSLPKSTDAQVMGSNSFVPEPRLLRTTELCVALVQGLSSSPEWVLWLQKLTNLYSG